MTYLIVYVPALAIEVNIWNPGITEMHLFVGISIITFLLNFYKNIIKFISLGSLFSRQEDDPITLGKLELAKEELKEIDLAPLDDYAKVVRRMRAENKINNLHKQLKADKNKANLKSASIDIFFRYSVKTALLLTLFIISVYYRYTPVVVFDDRFSFAPISYIVRFPTGVDNAISVPFFVLSCNLTFRWFMDALRKPM